MKRRALLASLTGASVAGGGCLGDRNDTGETDDGVPDGHVAGCGRSTTLTVEPIIPEDLVETITVSRTEIGDADLTLRIPALFERIGRVFDGDPTTIEVERAPPLQPAPYVRSDGAVYTVDTEIIEEGTVTGPEYRVTETTYREIRDEERTQHAALPNHELWRLAEGIRSGTDTVVAGFLDQRARDESILAEGADRLVVEFPDEIDLLGRYYLVERIGTVSSTVERTRYVSTRVGADPNAFSTHFLHEYGISLTDPDADVRTLLDDAIDTDRLEFCSESGQTSTEAAYETSLETLESQLREADPLDEATRDVLSIWPDSKYYVEYEDTWYVVDWLIGYA